MIAAGVVLLLWTALLLLHLMFYNITKSFSFLSIKLQNETYKCVLFRHIRPAWSSLILIFLITLHIKICWEFESFVAFSCFVIYIWPMRMYFITCSSKWKYLYQEIYTILIFSASGIWRMVLQIKNKKMSFGNKLELTISYVYWGEPIKVEIT